MAVLIEAGLLLALLYFAVGAVWLSFHYDTLTEFQAQWATVLPRFGDLVGFVVAALVWPVLLLLPMGCILPWGIG